MKNGVRIVAGLVLLVIPLLIPVGEGRDLAPVWSARYHGPDDGSDRAMDIAVDGSGNVYVTGIAGLINLSGETDSDYATIKYNTNGRQLWVARYNGPGNYRDEACAIAVDGSGNVYVTGSSEGLGYDWDYATIKYSTNGKQLWVARYNGPAKGYDEACAIAVDGSGNVYVTGSSTRSDNTNTTDYATIKYNTNGKQLWVARYKGPGNGDGDARAIVVDGSGNVYVTGESDGSGPYWDYATIKYGPNGKQLWVARYKGLTDDWDYASAIAVDGAGNVYVTGVSEGSGTDSDYATVKYNTNGKQLWVKRYNGPAKDPSSDWPSDIALDGSGNVYVTGRSKGSGTDYDYATIKYNTNGKQLWVKRYNGPGNGQDGASALAVDKSGNVYVTGESLGSSTYDYLTLKY